MAFLISFSSLLAISFPKKKKKAIKSHLPSFTATPTAGEGTKGTEGAYRWLLSQKAFRFLVTGPCVDPCDELTSQETLHAAIPTASFLPMHWGSSC